MGPLGVEVGQIVDLHTKVTDNLRLIQDGIIIIREDDVIFFKELIGAQTEQLEFAFIEVHVVGLLLGCKLGNGGLERFYVFRSLDSFGNLGVINKLKK